MKKALARTFVGLVCFVMLLSSAIPASAAGTEVGTNVSIVIQGFEITSRTEDFTLPVGDNQQLMVTTSGTVLTYTWEVSTDGGLSWAPAPKAANTSTYNISSAQPNRDLQERDVAYQYRVTVTNASGDTDSAVISVLVSNDYAYRTIALRNGDTDVSAYMHDQTRLMVTPLSDSSSAAAELRAELSSGHLPLILCDVSLVNQNNQVVPYFGALQVDFHVGSAYDGQTLNAYHLTGGSAVTYSGVVGAIESGVLSITVNTLSPFMVEAPATNTRTVTVSAGAGGSVSPSGTVNVADGSDKTFTFLPDEGYVIDSVTLNDTPVSITGNSYTLTSITQNHTVHVSFRQVTPSETLHTVTITGVAHGSVSPSGTIQMRQGAAQTIYFYPDRDYELDTVLVNGVAVSVIGSSYTLSAVTGNTTVSATFRAATTQPPNVYKTITASAGANGSISPAGDVSVEYGGGMYFYFMPNTGYEVDEVSIVSGNGTVTSVSGNFFHFTDVIYDYTIHVTFKLSVTPPPPPPPTTYHIITAASGANGSISPAGNILVAEGGWQTFYFIPKAGYEVDAVTIDGTALSVSGNAYRFSYVTSSHTISVTFRKTATPPDPVVYHTISAGSGENGAISPNGDVQISEGRNACFFFLPNEGYEMDMVTVDGRIVEAEENSYCFENVYANHTIHVTFKKAASAPEPTVYHTISVSIKGNGSISPSGDVQVADGGAQTFYLIVEDGYEVEAIYVNGEKQDVIGSQFAVDNITGDMELSVVFRSISHPASFDASHCFICGWFGRNIVPWCWLIPLIIVIGVGGVVWVLLRKHRR